ncbi:MAG: NAD(P)-dependent oxidoreductase [Pseudomonadota bacterium]|nr:UDP-N-acetylglucosamine 4-epimerase [Gammaproteobacteria bacterium]MEE2684468.1 NAD(P)-dependent oxidoreductase [Pseudomonadota bacterium]|tara:strand:- start:44 stop:1021 length:978 start_codon:yes stop_codon:yes gene_type:complete
MKIAIIGGAGFVGNSLSKRLDKQNIDHMVFDRQSGKSSHIYIDVTKKNSLDLIKDADIIINLAAVHRDDVKPITLYDDVNVQGARNICDAADKHNINKIIFTSSVAVYGFAPLNTGEDGDTNFFNDYGRTKYLAEQIFKEWQLKDSKNRSLVIVRPTVIFGEGNRGNVFNLLNQIASKKFIMFGSGKNIKSMAYVENVAAFLEYSIKFKSGIHIYNYIDKPDLDMNELISITRKILFDKEGVGLRLPKILGIVIGRLFDFLSFLLKRNLSISSIRVKKFMSNSQFNSSIQELSFTPPVELRQGLERTLIYEFLEDNRDKNIFETE